MMSTGRERTEITRRWRPKPKKKKDENGESGQARGRGKEDHTDNGK